MSYKDLYDSIKTTIIDIATDNPSFKRSDINKVVNQILVEHETGKKENDLDIVEFFSGRGKAWLKVDKKANSHIWNNITSLLNVDTNHSNFYNFSSYKDLFEDAGFAWLRYSGVNKKGIQFHLRYMGSKNEEHIKIFVDKNQFKSLINLDGVPHRLGLETGYPAEKKEKIISSDPEVSSNNMFTKIEDLI